jgi:ribosomal protein L37AE/L43A
MMSMEHQEEMRVAARNEVGTEPPCPFCGKPRVLRSSYIRCNRCGVNWLAEEMSLPDYLNLDPRVARAISARMGNSTKRIAEQLVDSADK